MTERTLAIALVLVTVLAGCTSEDGGAPADGEAPTPPIATWSWGALADVPTPRTEVAAVVLWGDLVVLGGFAASSAPSAAVEALNLTTGTWRMLAPLPVPLHHAPAVVHQGRIHVLGGYTTQAFLPTTLHLVYDPSMALWTTGETLPRARGAHGAAVVDGRAYLVGGVGEQGLLATVDVIDLGTGRWSTGPDLPLPRDHLAVQGLDGGVHAVGGREQSLSSNTGAHHVLAPGGEWMELEAVPTPRGGIGAGVVAGLLVVVGGEENGGTFDEVEAYDAATGTWSALPALPTPRHGLGVVGHQDRLYVAAGGPQPGLTVSGAVEVLSMDTAAP